eukprot:7658240-Ditylum_brightwellii.AAC.1
MIITSHTITMVIMAMITIPAFCQTVNPPLPCGIPPVVQAAMTVKATYLEILMSMRLHQHILN